MGLISQSLGGAAPQKEQQPERSSSIWDLPANLVGDVADIGKGLTQLAGAGLSDAYRGIAELVTGGNYTGGEGRPGGRFSLDDIAINLTGIDPGDPERSAATPSAFLQDLSTRYGPLLRGDLAEFGRQAVQHPGFLALDLLGAGSAAGKGAQLAGRSAIASRAGGAGRAGEIASAAKALLGEAGRKQRPALVGQTLDELAGAGETLSPLEGLASRILPRPRQVLQPAGAGATAIETIFPSHNPVARGLRNPIERAMTQPLADSDAARNLARLEEMKAAGEPLAFADEEWLKTVGKAVKEAQAGGVPRVYKPYVSGRLLRNSVTKLVGSHQAEWLARREADLAEIREITRPVVEEGLDDVAHGAAQGLDAVDDVAAALEIAQEAPAAVGLPSGGGVATRARTTDALAAFERLDAAELAEDATQATRVRDLARPAYDYAAELRQQAVATADPELARKASLAERYLDGLLEPLRLEERAKRGEAVSTIERWKENMRLHLAEAERGLIEAGIRTPDELLTRAYLPLRYRFGAKWNHQLGDFEGGPSVEALDDAMRAAGRSAPIYFPHVDPRRLKLTDWLMSRQRIGARKASADQHLKRNTAELLDKDVYIKDPIEAYSRRAARAIRAEETARMVQKVADTYGRKLGPDDVLATGEVVWAPDGLRRFFRTTMRVEDEIADLMKAGNLSADDALAQAMREVFKDNLDEVRRTMIGSTGKGLDLYAVPHVVADQIEAFTKYRLGRNTRLFWDGPTNVWRSFVLLGSPRWIVNNFLGNTVFQKLQGGRFRGVWSQADKEYRELLRQVPGADEVEGGLYSAQSRYVEKLGSAGREGVGRAIESIKGTPLYRGFEAAGRKSGNFNAHLENAFRREAFVTALERQQVSAVKRVARTFWGSKRRLEAIIEQGASPQMIGEAIEEANRFFGDYKGLGPVERGIVRRFMLPFYGFYKHVMKLAVSMPTQSPGRTIALRHLGEVSRDFQQDLGPLPPWLEDIGFPLGPSEDGEAFLLAGGPNPLNFATDLAEDPIATLGGAINPLVKTGFEQTTGRSMFTGRQFTDEDVVQPYGSDQGFRVVRDGEGNVVGMEPVEKTVPNLLEHLAQQIPQYQLVKDLWAGGATYDTASLPDVVAGGGVIRDSETGEPRYPTDALEKVLRILGVSTMDYDVAGFQDRLAEQQEQAMAEAQRRAGAAGGASGGPRIAGPGTLAALLG